MAFRCLLCHPNVVNCADNGNMKSHLGAVKIHNMGPFRCQHPGCTARSVRDKKQTHGNHAANWVRDQALAAAVSDLAGQCELPWARGVFPGAVPRVLPAAPPPAVLPPAAVPGARGVARPAPLRAPDDIPADDLALAQDVEWQQWKPEEEQEGREPAPGYYAHFDVPYGTGPDIPGGR